MLILNDGINVQAAWGFFFSIIPENYKIFKVIGAITLVKFSHSTPNLKPAVILIIIREVTVYQF